MAIRPLIESFDKKPLNAEQIFVSISIYRDRFLQFSLTRVPMVA